LSRFGYNEECPAEQQFRDATVTEIMDGTPELQMIVMARERYSTENLFKQRIYSAVKGR